MKIFANKSQLGAFGEFVYMEYSKSLGFKVERTNLCHTDYYLEDRDKNKFYYVDVKSAVSDKSKYSGTRYHDEIIYESILVLGERVFFVPDNHSPFYGFGRKDLGALSEWIVKWSLPSEASVKRRRKIAEVDVDSLKAIFKNSKFPKIRFVERGDASEKRWSGTVDNLPGTDSTINKYDATLFVVYSCENFKEKINKIYLISHSLLHAKCIKMIKSNSRQLKKGFIQHIDLQSFEKDYPEFVFDGLSTLSFYIKKHCLLDTHNNRLRKLFV
jgi:hypothetical protein